MPRQPLVDRYSAAFSESERRLVDRMLCMEVPVGLRGEGVGSRYMKETMLGMAQSTYGVPARRLLERYWQFMERAV